MGDLNLFITTLQVLTELFYMEMGTGACSETVINTASMNKDKGWIGMDWHTKSLAHMKYS